MALASEAQTTPVQAAAAAPALAAAPSAPSAAAAPYGPRIALAGQMGARRALLLIDGQPRVLTVGDSAGGVTLLQLSADAATVRVAGQVRQLRLGDSPARLDATAAPPSTAGRSIHLAEGAGGHFGGQLFINGSALPFLVDTGASTVALGRSQAEQVGIDWQRGKPLITQTANGRVAVHGVTLPSVRVNGIEVLQVPAVVMPGDLPLVLLGNSFLQRFSLQRDGRIMRLELKPQ